MAVTSDMPDSFSIHCEGVISGLAGRGLCPQANSIAKQHPTQRANFEPTWYQGRLPSVSSRHKVQVRRWCSPGGKASLEPPRWLMTPKTIRFGV